MERREPGAARSPAPLPPSPDTFRDAVTPGEAEERELAAELADAMRQISGLPLGESARRILDRELQNARSTAERLQILRQWFASMKCAYAVTKAVVAGRDVAAELRGSRPQPEERPRSIARWLRR
jgi:hypothetical protein